MLDTNDSSEMLENAFKTQSVSSTTWKAYKNNDNAMVLHV